jgi:hypothetical protein
LGSQFPEAWLLNCREVAQEGMLVLSDHFRNICFIQGLASEQIQMIVQSRKYQNFDKTAEEWKSAVAYMQETLSQRSDRV